MYLYRLFTNFGHGISREGLLNVVAFVVALLAALILHEIAHGLVALWNGDNTAKMYGRLSVNPLRHFDWIGLLFMLVVGFGWARPVPVNPNNFKNRKVGVITVSIAGVLTNILLAFLSAMGVVIFGNIGVVEGSSVYYLVYFFYMLSLLMLQLNISFALFNILPLFPLDGYRLLSSFVDENKSGMRFLRKYSVYILLGLIALGYVFDILPFVSGYSPLDLYILKLGGWIVSGFLKFWRLIF